MHIFSAANFGRIDPRADADAKREMMMKARVSIVAVAAAAAAARFICFQGIFFWSFLDTTIASMKFNFI